MAVKVVQRETHEYVPVEVTKDGTIITANLEYSIVPWGDRPVSWSNMVVSGQVTYVEVNGLDAGYYDIYVRITDAPETPVIRPGNLKVE